MAQLERHKTKPLYLWSRSQGLRQVGGPGLGPTERAPPVANTEDPFSVLEHIAEAEKGLFVLCDYGPYLAPFGQEEPPIGRAEEVVDPLRIGRGNPWVRLRVDDEHRCFDVGKRAAQRDADRALRILIDCRCIDALRDLLCRASVIVRSWRSLPPCSCPYYPCRFLLAGGPAISADLLVLLPAED